MTETTRSAGRLLSLACVVVTQVSSPRGTALTRESGGNVTRPVSFTVPGTASRAVVSSTIEIEPVIVSCATDLPAVFRAS